MSLTSELLGGAGIAAITQEGIGQARALPGQLETAANRIAGNVGTASEFRPYSVTTGAGSSNFTDSGMTQALDPQSQQLVDSLRQQSTQQAGMLGGMTPEGLMQQMSALRAPEQARQTIANLGQQQLQGIPASINAEALLRQSQMEGLINILGLSGGGNTAGGVAGNLAGGSNGAIADLLGGAGKSIWDSLFGSDGEYSKGDYSDMFGAGVISDGDRAFDDDYENMFGGN